jgi:hypothetical protein
MSFALFLVGFFLFHQLLVLEGHFEHLQAKPEDRNGGKRCESSPQENRDRFVAHYVWSEPQGEEYPSNGCDHDIDHCRFGCHFITTRCFRHNENGL